MTINTFFSFYYIHTNYTYTYRYPYGTCTRIGLLCSEFGTGSMGAPHSVVFRRVLGDAWTYRFLARPIKIVIWSGQCVRDIALTSERAIKHGQLIERKVCDASGIPSVSIPIRFIRVESRPCPRTTYVVSVLNSSVFVFSTLCKYRFGPRPGPYADVHV